MLVSEWRTFLIFMSNSSEYCSVAFHSSLTVEHNNKIERIQKTSLKVILSEMYVDYPSALEMTGLDSLSARRVKKCLNFSLKCLKHERNQKLFPLNPNAGMFNVRNSEVFTVNFAGSSTYRDCAIPFCQRLLNNHFPDKKAYLRFMTN